MIFGALLVAVLVLNGCQQETYPTEEHKTYIDKAKVCDTICSEKGLLSTGYSENQEERNETTQRSYDYACNCLAQPMKLCDGDEDCVKGIGYCNLTYRVCMPLKR